MNFFSRLRRYEQISIENRVFEGTERFDPKFQVEGVVPHQPYSLRSFMWYKNVGTSFFHFVTIHAFDRQTDGQTYSYAFAIPCVALHACSRSVKGPLRRRRYHFSLLLSLRSSTVIEPDFTSTVAHGCTRWFRRTRRRAECQRNWLYVLYCCCEHDIATVNVAASITDRYSYLCLLQPQNQH